MTDRYPDTLYSRLSKDFILAGMKLILRIVSLCFNGIYSKQEKVIAMGTNFAPMHTTLTVGYLEKKTTQEYDFVETNNDTVLMFFKL